MPYLHDDAERKHFLADLADTLAAAGYQTHILAGGWLLKIEKDGLKAEITAEITAGSLLVVESEDEDWDENEGTCTSNACERPECHRCFPETGCDAHQKCRDWTRDPW